MAYTNDSGTRMDWGKNLCSSKQRVNSPTIPDPVIVHLRYSPAGGSSLQQGEFTQGHRWTEAPGKIQPHFGKVNI